MHPRNPDDRRVTLASLTSARRALASQQLIPAGHQAAALFDDPSEHGPAELLRVLGEVIRDLQLRGVETRLSTAAAQKAARATVRGGPA